MCHGDFHPGNLLDAGDRLLGLDFFDTGRKLAVYDMVDFLKGDIRTDAPAGEIDAGGVRRQVRAALLEGYGQPVDEALLSFLLRAQLLIDWLHIDASLYAGSAFQQTKLQASGEPPGSGLRRRLNDKGPDVSARPLFP